MIMYINKTLCISVILVSILVLFSGCSGTQKYPDNSNPDSLVIVEQIPKGYEYLGYHEISDYNKFSENIITSKEGAYRDEDDVDVFLNVIELDSESAALEFISNYQEQFNQLPDGNRFSSITFNGHDATIVKTYRLNDGIQVPKYQIIWNSDNIVFLVISNSQDERSAEKLAETTGY